MAQPVRILFCPLFALAIAATAAAAPSDLAGRIAAIEAAQAVELAHLDEAMAAANGQPEVLGLQRCAAYVKLASVLALYEAQLAAAPDGGDAPTLAALIGDLRARVAAARELTPADYAFDPLADPEREVQPCAE